MKKIIAILLLSSLSSLAYYEEYDYQSKCTKNNSDKLEKEYKCLLTGKDVVPSVTNSSIDTLLATPLLVPIDENHLENEITSLKDLYKKRMEKLGDFTRFLKGDNFPEARLVEFEDLLEEQRLGHKRLTETQKALNETVKKQNNSGVYGDTALQRHKLEDQIATLKKLKKNLKLNHPLLVSKELKASLESDESLDTKKLLIQNLVTTFNRDRKMKAMLASYQVAHKKMVSSNGLDNSNHMYHISSLKHGEAIDLILANGFNNWHERTPQKQVSLCQIAYARKKVKSAVENVEKAGSVALLGLTVIPMTFAYTSGLSAFKAMNAVKAIKGLKAYPYLKLLPAFSQPKLAATSIGKALKKVDECRTKRNLFISSSTKESLGSWQKCVKQESTANTIALVSSLPYATIAKLPSFLLNRNTVQIYNMRGVSLTKAPTIDDLATTKIYKDFNSGKNSLITFKKDGYTYTAINLEKISAGDFPAASKLANDYLEKTLEVYAKKLKLTTAQLEDFKAVSMSLNNRTKLIVVSKGPLTKGNIKGGVGFIASHNAKKPLPFELELKSKTASEAEEIISRGKNGLVEIIRLTSTAKDKTGNIMRNMLGQVALILKSGGGKEDVAIYTSKSLLAYYRRMNINGKIVKKISKSDDLVIQFSSAEVRSLAN